MQKIIKIITIFVIVTLVRVIPAAGSDVLAGSVVDLKQIEQHDDSWGFPHKEGIVLVLSGGGTKGLSHIGVFEVLEQEKIPVAAIVGTSMGAIMGGLYASGYTAQEMKDMIENVDLMEIISDRSNASFLDVGYNKPTSGGNSILSFQIDRNNLPRGKLGVLPAKDLYTFLSELTSRVTVTDFNNLAIPFAAIATDLETGNTVVLRDGNLASALRASLSIPGAFDPWEMEGRLLVDGGLKANLPVLEAKKLFPGHPIVAVNLSPEDITVSKDKLRSLIEVAAQTLEILMVNQIRENVAAADVVISPQVSGFSILGSSDYDKIIERGHAAAEQKKDTLHELLSQHRLMYTTGVHSAPLEGHVPTVVAIRFEGVPKSISDTLYDKYDDWIGRPLDMRNVAEAVKILSDREGFRSVQGRTLNYTKDTVALIFSIERSAKYEFGINGYFGSIHPDRWLALNAQVRDTLSYGDIALLELRLGSQWGALMRYFTPLNEDDSQLNLLLLARKESVNPLNANYFEFERYIGRVVWYKNFKKTRIGLGYQVEKANFMDRQTLSGPYLSLSINTLDDPVVPTKGTALTSDIWFPLGEEPVTRTRFQTHIPILQSWKVILSGGLKTGDAENLAYAAMLGSNEELYSLAHSPLVGDQAYWLHLGAARMLTKSWWGGINVEVFGNYGQVMNDWKNKGSWWEAGIALSVPTNNFLGKFTIVYDQGGAFTFGYSIGIPIWWNGPLP